MDNSASSQFDYVNSKPMSFDDYWQTYYGGGSNGVIKNPNSFGAKVWNFFSGDVTSAKQSYENYLSDFESKRNQQLAAQANAATFEREDSQVQRLMQDYQKAGLNPYLLMSGGNLSSGVASSAAQHATYKRQSKASEEAESKLFNSALKIMALILLKKM